MSYLDKFKLSALVASIGFNDGANKGFWRIQPRAAKGRQGAGQWIEMGAELRALLKVKGKLVSVIGRSVGSNGTPDGVRVLFQGLADQGIPDSIVEIPTRFLDLVSASIPEELLKKKGISKPGAAEEMDQDAPNFEDLQRAEVTPDDIRIANEGINSPEGKEQEAFKNSPEGKAIEAAEAEEAPAPEGPLLSPPARTKVAKLVDKFKSLALNKFNGRKSNGEKPQASYYSRYETGKVLKDQYDDSLSSTYTTTATLDFVTEDGGYSSVTVETNGATGASSINYNNGRVTVKKTPNGKYEVTVNSSANNESQSETFADEREAKAAANSIINDSLGFPADTDFFDMKAQASKELAKVNNNPRIKNKRDFINIDSPLSKEIADHYQALSDSEDEWMYTDGVLGPIRESLTEIAGDDPELFADAFRAMDDYLLTGTEKLQSVANAIKSQKLGDIQGSKEKARQAQYKALKTLEAEGVDVGNINRTGSTPAEDREIDGPNGQVTPRMRQAAIRKAAQDIAEGKPVTVDDVITYASKGEPKASAIKPKGQKLNLKPGDMKPGDRFDYKGEEYSFESAGERDRVSKTQDVVATNLRTGKSEDVILDTDKTTPILRPDAVQPEPAAPAAPKAPEAAPVAPKAPAAPKAPVAKKTEPLPKATPAPKPEELAAPERVDNGQDIAFSPLTDEELYNRQVAFVVPDANGKTKKAHNPITGKNEIAQDPDAIVTTLLQDHPEAVIKPNGEIILQRETFTDNAGKEWKIESFVVRTDGANFMVGYRLKDVASGEEKTYYSYDYRDSYASIFGKPADPTTGKRRGNGIRRISDVLQGKDEILSNENSKEFKQFFAPGRGVDGRLRYFRDKYKSTATEESLAKALEKAKAGGKTDVIAEAQDRYDMLFDKFGGDIDRFREWDTIQNMRFLNIEETARKYISGRPRRLNESKSTKGGENASQEANVLRSAVPSLVDAILTQDTATITEHMVAVQGRMPMLSKNPEVAKLMLDMISEEVNARIPQGSRRKLAGYKTAAYNQWIDNTYTPDNANSVPHVGSDGTVIKPGYFVEYENSQGVKSRGYVVSVNERVANPRKPNEYFDTVNVKFVDSKGNISKATARLWAKNLTTYDKTGDNAEARKQMTKYTPNPRGEDKIAQRFGENYLQYDSEDPNLGSEGEEGEDIGGEGKVVDDYEEGDLHFSKEGELLGEVVDVTPVTNKKGQSGFVITYIDENGDLQRDTVKAGEFRGPKP